jgi:hypothetical protein
MNEKACHLINNVQLSPDYLKEQLERIEEVLDCDDFTVIIMKCKDCGQLFIYCFREYTRPNWEDDYWTFWVPASQDEIDTLKKAEILMKFMGELIAEKSHICWNPEGKVFWSESGNPIIAHIIFLPL